MEAIAGSRDCRDTNPAALGRLGRTARARLYESRQRGCPFGPNSTTPVRARVSCFAGERR
jgi:hypothetical protein